ncbi:RpnC/YadD family protein [Caldicellulosiruptor morganii]|uniref:Uncharacterized protein n=1 Tax=Caldicellulosiruptor morganii TaxID=1387555 RepID=A0ABY7BMZ2_9FIRM|nr:hypothetical protein [Caldicellulosiruptor morganii]WAM33890.1 hypothetical protein OTK00_000030 [Caldicellulosiruptor morganii]
MIWAGNVIRPRLTKEDKEEFDRLVERVKQGGAGKMGEFVSNVSRLLDEVQMKKFNEGKIEGKEEVARKLINRGFSDEDIAELTDFDIERIKKLRKELIN